MLFFISVGNLRICEWNFNFLHFWVGCLSLTAKCTLAQKGRINECCFQTPSCATPRVQRYHNVLPGKATGMRKATIKIIGSSQSILSGASTDKVKIELWSFQRKQKTKRPDRALMSYTPYLVRNASLTTNSELPGCPLDMINFFRT